MDMEMPRTRKARQARVAVWEARMAATRNEWAAKAAEMNRAEAPAISAKFTECAACGVWVSNRVNPTEAHAEMHNREAREEAARNGNREVRV